MEKIKDAWIIVTKDRLFRSTKTFKGLPAAKRSCVCDYTAVTKDELGEILHVQNGIVKSSVLVDHVGEGVMMFSSVHIIYGEKKLEDYILA